MHKDKDKNARGQECTRTRMHEDKEKESNEREKTFLNPDQTSQVRAAAAAAAAFRAAACPDSLSPHKESSMNVFRNKIDRIQTSDAFWRSANVIVSLSSCCMLFGSNILVKSFVS